MLKITYLFIILYPEPTTVAVLSKAWIIFASSDAGVMSSNPTEDMDVCVCALILCVCVFLCR
jgi:hypothetical protein